MVMFFLPRVLAYDPVSAAPVANGIRVTTWTEEFGGAQVPTYDQAGNPMELFTEGYTVPGTYVADLPGAWHDAGAGRFYVEAPKWARTALTEVQAAVVTVSAFEARVASLEAGGGGGGTGGGSQLGLVEDVFTIATENGSTLIGADGTSIARTSFTYAEVPVGHRLVIKDHPDYAASAVQPLLPAAFWGEAAKANPQAEFVSFRTPVAA